MFTIERSRRRLRAPDAKVALCTALTLGLFSAGAFAQDAPLDPYELRPYQAASAPGAPLDPYAGARVPAPLPPPPLSAPQPDPYGSFGPPAEMNGACFTNVCGEQQPYRPSSPVVDMRPQKPQRNTRLLGAGLGLFNATWAVTALASAVSDRRELAVPLVGPILTLVDLNANNPRSFALQVAATWLIIDAMAQTAGVVMAIVGGTTHRKVHPAGVAFSGSGVVGRF